MSLDRIRIVLINTSHPGNIGGAARAMKNMGLDKLYLVEPRKYPHEEAAFRAANALDVLDGAVVCSSLNEALEGCTLVIGTSARQRRIPWPLLNPRETAERAKAELETGLSGDIAIMFGREDRGLTNEELQLCNYHLHIPGNEEYSVLNLAAAVQVVCYEMRMCFKADQVQLAGLVESDWDQPLVDAVEVEKLLAHFEQVLKDIGFYDPTNPKQVLARLRRLVNRVRLDRLEMNILRGILAAIERKVDEPSSSDCDKK